METFDLMLVGLAGLAGGAVNALAGGGTLITFPMLTLVGVPAVAANVTNTVALCPGYFGATVAQFGDLRGQHRRLWMLLPASALGGVLGGILLLNSGERLFRGLVPYLILLAAGLLACQERLRTWLGRRTGRQPTPNAAGTPWTSVPVGIAAIYGGYFGAGLSVIILALLGLVLDDSLTRLSALKQAVALCVNVSTAALFVFSGQVAWSAAAVMAVGALVGGAVGGRVASRVKPAWLRWTVVSIGLAVGLIYLVA